jgi:hypothetical protein
MALDTGTKRRRALRSFFGLGLKGHSYLVADGAIDQTDRAQIVGFYFTPTEKETYLKLTSNISPPPIQTTLIDDKYKMTVEWQRWFCRLVKSIQETQVIIYKQNIEPTIPTGYNFAMWQDTKNSDKTYFIYRRNESDQIKVELT